MSRDVLDSTIIRVIGSDDALCVELELLAQSLGAKVISRFSPQLTHVVLADDEASKQVPDSIKSATDISTVSAGWLRKCRDDRVRHDEYCFSQEQVPIDRTHSFHEDSAHEIDNGATKNPVDTSLDDFNLADMSSQVRFDDGSDQGNKPFEAPQSQPSAVAVVPASMERCSADIFSPVILDMEAKADETSQNADAKEEIPEVDVQSSAVSFGSHGVVGIFEDDEPLLFPEDKEKKKKRLAEDTRRVSFPPETIEKDELKSKTDETKQNRAEHSKIADIPVEEDSTSGLNTSDASWNGEEDPKETKKAKPRKSTTGATQQTSAKKSASTTKRETKEDAPEESLSPRKKKKSPAKGATDASSDSAAPRTPRVKKAAASASHTVAPVVMNALEDSPEKTKSKSEPEAENGAASKRKSPRRKSAEIKEEHERVEEPEPPVVSVEPPKRPARRASSSMNAAEEQQEPAASKPSASPPKEDIKSSTKKKATNVSKKKAAATETEPTTVEANVQPDKSAVEAKTTSTTTTKKRARGPSETTETPLPEEESSPPKRQKKKEKPEEPPAIDPAPASQQNQKPSNSGAKKTGKRKRLEDDADETENQENLLTPSKKSKVKRATSSPSSANVSFIVLSSCDEDTRAKATAFASTQKGTTLQGSVTTQTNVVVLGGKKRTLKTFMGIACGAWLVKSSWIDSSISEGSWANLEDHEAADWFPGARLSRLSGKGGKIFSKLKFFVHGELEISHKDLESVITAAGGNVVKAPLHADYVISGGRRMFKPDPGNPEEAHLQVKDLEWVMECVTSWSLSAAE